VPFTDAPPLILFLTEGVLKASGKTLISLNFEKSEFFNPKVI
jgi:hypothetical protein